MAAGPAQQGAVAAPVQLPAAVPAQAPVASAAPQAVQRAQAPAAVQAPAAQAPAAGGAMDGKHSAPVDPKRDAVDRFYGTGAYASPYSGAASASAPPRPAHPAGSAAERQRLMAALSRQFRDAQPMNTTSTYGVYQRQYKEFCKQKGWDWSHRDNRDAYVASFLQSRAKGKDALSHRTLLGPVSGAIYDLFRMETDNPMSSVLVKETKKMVKWIAPAPRKAKDPLPLEWLRKAVFAARRDKDQVRGWRDASILLIMYTALLRQSEVVKLEPADIRFDSYKEGKVTRSMVFVTVRKAKNDQERKGSERPVPEFPDDRALCLWVTLKKYMALRDGRNPNLFYNAKVPESRGARGLASALASTTPTFVLRERLEEAGMAVSELSRYASNSLRKGGASRAFSAGVSRLAIKRHGAWRSDAVDAYITVPMVDHIGLVDAILREEDVDDDEDD